MCPGAFDSGQIPVPGSAQPPIESGSEPVPGTLLPSGVGPQGPQGPTGPTGPSGGGSLNGVQFREITTLILAGNSAVVTDTAPTLFPTKTGTILVAGTVSGSAGVGSDNGAFADVTHSLDGGATWIPVTAPPQGDQRQPLSGLPAPGGIAAAITTNAQFAFIVSIPSSVGSPLGVKFRILVQTSGGSFAAGGSGGGGGLVAVEIG